MSRMSQATTILLSRQVPMVYDWGPDVRVSPVVTDDESVLVLEALQRDQEADECPLPIPKMEDVEIEDALTNQVRQGDRRSQSVQSLDHTWPCL